MLSQWIRNAQKCGIGQIIKVVKVFETHLTGIVNAMAERLNGKIQEIKTSSKGYRTFEKFKSAILFFNGGLDLYPHSSQ